MEKKQINSKRTTIQDKSVKAKEGIPMSEESIKEWRKSFSDIEESIEAFYKKEKKKQKK